MNLQRHTCRNNHCSNTWHYTPVCPNTPPQHNTPHKLTHPQHAAPEPYTDATGDEPTRNNISQAWQFHQNVSPPVPDNPPDDNDNDEAIENICTWWELTKPEEDEDAWTVEQHEVFQNTLTMFLTGTQFTPEEVVRLFRRLPRSIANKTAQNTHTPTYILDVFARTEWDRDQYETFYRARLDSLNIVANVAGNPSTSPATLEWITHIINADGAEQSSELSRKYSWRGLPDVPCRIVGNPTTPIHVWDSFLAS